MESSKAIVLKDFILKLKKFPRVVIQAHDYPDHDAVSSAWALSYLLKSFDVQSIIVFKGEIDRISLSNMINWLDIPILEHSKAALTPNDKIITIDGCIGENNVTDIDGEEIAVIDHHQVTPPESLWFTDIRPNYGACVSILVEYFQSLDVKLTKQIASALLVGLNVDTANLTRGFCSSDINAFVELNKIADLSLVNRICRNELLAEELDFYASICKSVEINNGTAIAIVKESCPPTLLGVLADFLLKVDEVDVVVVANIIDNSAKLSLRSECSKVNVGLLLKKLLNERNIGFGGGHAHMAGGVLNNQGSHQEVHFAIKALFESIYTHKSNE